MSLKTDVDRFHDGKFATDRELDYKGQLGEYFRNSVGSNVEKLKNFPKYVPRQTLTRFVTRYEIFKKALNVQGSIVECGVLFGGGLMTFAQLSAIMEPVNHQRKIVGFDTFEGFPGLHDNDKGGESNQLRAGGYGVDSYADLKEAVRLYDANRFLSHMPKVELVRGDVTRTVPEYLEKHKHMIVSLLYLDMDIYEPTRVALEHFLPRIPKGGVVAFDELNSETWPGETVAVLEAVGISRLRIQRFPFDTYASYAVIE
ncbi:MAG: TylF/MycF family methyltransferase [Chloroflexi bacterium]|nr:TylF/MycF family methyltransferase [Chloroflexota bacterium]